jgi:hypothetical protein
MTDQEWDGLTWYRRLPNEARAPIEAELDLYSRFASAVAQPPSATRKNLEHAAELASRLLKATSGFGPDEHHALVEFVGATPRLDALKLLADQSGRVAALRDRLTTAASKIEKGKRDAGNQRALVSRVNQVIVAHTGRPLSKAKEDLHFACKLGELAKPAVGPGSIKEAIENLVEPNLAFEKVANSG